MSVFEVYSTWGVELYKINGCKYSYEGIKCFILKVIAKDNVNKGKVYHPPNDVPKDVENKPK